MSRTRTCHCDGPECDRNWTKGFAIVVSVGDDEFDFCSWDCVLKFGVQESAPGERVPITPYFWEDDE